MMHLLEKVSSNWDSLYHYKKKVHHKEVYKMDDTDLKFTFQANENLQIDYEDYYDH